ncbi:MAG: endonuclease V [Candidatus Omnitrophota bacterium]|nr:MAG: endonuclease V [Candidatus Omnitrophota bacterium]
MLVYKKSTIPLLKILDSIQSSLKKKICLRNTVKKKNTIAGADVHYEDRRMRACVCVLEYPSCRLLEKVSARGWVTFPYISGYLCFREGPVILKAISKLKTQPDCFIFDGNGILHPRNMGLATFLGIALKKPAIGCAKTLLLGKHKKVAEKRGSFAWISHRNKVLGAVLRTKDNTNAVYVSVGWGITLKKAIEIVLKTSRYRIPESLRLAHTCSKVPI